MPRGLIQRAVDVIVSLPLEPLHKQSYAEHHMVTGMRRINTQVPRRTKVQPATPMESEWDISTGTPPNGLRTPANKMTATRGKSQASASESPESDEQVPMEPHS